MILSECIYLTTPVSLDDERDESLVPSEDSSSSSSSEEEVVYPPPRAKVIKIQTGFKEGFGIAFKHCNTKTIHYVVGHSSVGIGASLVFSCGRKVSAKFAEVKSFDPFNMCSMCKKHARRDGAFKD